MSRISSLIGSWTVAGNIRTGLISGIRLEGLGDILFEFAERTGRLSGLLAGLSADTQVEAIIDLMVSEAIKISEIEGEYLSRQDVMSSIRNKLDLSTA